MADRSARGLIETRPAEPDVAAADARAATLTLFTALWAVATLFHLWVDRRAGGVLTDRSAEAIAQALTGVVAIGVLARPRSSAALVGLAALGPVLAWYEAPFLGNHWLLAALIDLGIVLAAVAVWRREKPFDRAKFASAALPLCRWSLLGFYSFAAFSKLNSAFLDPEVSCGTFFFDELAGSFGVGTPFTVTSAGWARLVPLGVIAIELSVPVLLLIRRTRHLGVIVGLLFHGLIAFDSAHPFHDFSALLLALLVLFLPDGFAVWVRDRLRARPQARELLAAVAVVGSAALMWVVIEDPGGATERFVLLDGRAIAWAVLLALTLVAVVTYLRTERPSARTLLPDMRIAPGWLAIIPVLVIGNGLTPYLEVKTAYGWNMYANLVTVDGETNHLLVPRTLPMTDYQADLVRIVATDDGNLALYAAERYDLPFIQLRDYLSRHPDVSIWYERAGVVHRVERASDDPALVEPVPAWQQRLFVFRAVDQQDPARCQPVWYPAR